MAGAPVAHSGSTEASRLPLLQRLQGRFADAAQRISTIQSASYSERGLDIPAFVVDRVQFPAERSVIRVANLHPLAGNRWHVHHRPW